MLVGLATILAPGPGDGSSIGSAFDRAGTVDNSLDDGLTGRTAIWDTSVQLIADRPWFAFEDGRPAIIKHLLGYGPDTFIYVYPLRDDPIDVGTLDLIGDGHNQWLHAAVEMGIPAALALLAVTVIALGTGIRYALGRAASWSTSYRLVLVAVVAGIAGRTVEQLFGVSQVSDSLYFWMLAGMLVALPSVAAGRAVPAVDAASVSLPIRTAAGVACGALAVVAYRTRAAGLFDAVRLRTEDVDDNVLLQGALDVLEDGLPHNPLSLTLNIGIAERRMNLVRRGRADLADATAEAFERVAALFPNHTQPQRNLAVALLELGRPGEALAPLARMFELAPGSERAAEVLFFKGVALRDLGRNDEAVATLIEAREDARSDFLSAQIDALLESLRVAN